MEWEGDPFRFDIVRLLEFFNTPGNEVAPGSDIVGENLQQDWGLCAHLCLLVVGCGHWLLADFSTRNKKAEIVVQSQAVSSSSNAMREST